MAFNPNALSNEEYFAMQQKFLSPEYRTMQQAAPNMLPTPQYVNGFTVSTPHGSIPTNLMQIIASYLRNGGFNPADLSPVESAGMEQYLLNNGRITIADPWYTTPQPQRHRPVGGFFGPTTVPPQPQYPLAYPAEPSFLPVIESGEGTIPISALPTPQGYYG